MTSNVGIRDIQDRGAGIGFANASSIERDAELAKSILEKALKNKFQPEFLNRIDDIIIFDKLKEDEIAQILRLELKDLLNRSLENGYTFELDEKAEQFIVKHGYDEKYGARPIKRMVQNHVEDLLAELWIDGKLQEGDHVKITVAEDEKGLKELLIEQRSI
jgi:ATP-dependent Clp protease ATP-binding subunit ClpC